MAQVWYYTTAAGENPVSKFLDSLSEKQQAKILRVIHSIKDYGLNAALPHIKKLTGTPLWEIRILGKDNIRVFYVIPGKELILVLHGFIKKKQKTPIKEITIALERLGEWQYRHRPLTNDII